MPTHTERFDTVEEMIEKVKQFQKTPNHVKTVMLNPETVVTFQKGKAPHWHIKACLEKQKKLDAADRLRLKLLKKKAQQQLTDAVSDEEELEDCEWCGYTHHSEDKCPTGKQCSHYEKWRNDESLCSCGSEIGKGDCGKCRADQDFAAMLEGKMTEEEYHKKWLSN